MQRLRTVARHLSPTSSPGDERARAVPAPSYDEAAPGARAAPAAAAEPLQPSGVDTGVIPEADRRTFERDGCIVLHEFLGPERLAAVRAAVEAGIASEGERSGWEQAAHFAKTKRPF